VTANIFLRKVAYPGITSEKFGGTACTGTDKTTGRELFVADGVSIVVVHRKILIPTVDYTESGGTVTFNIPVDNRHKLAIFR